MLTKNSAFWSTPHRAWRAM